MAQELLRVFSSGDDEMLERAQVFHDRLSDELADFTARFPWLDGAWLTAYQADITAADAFPKDESVLLDLKVLTGDVTAAMQQGYAALLTLGGYAKLAWPTDMARQKVFGQQYWANASKNTLKLQEALELAYAKANSASYKPGLLAKGYTQPEIDMLNTLATDLQTKNGLQEALKMGRHVTKHDRIALLNVVWGHMQTVNTCASVVWAGDAEREDQYQLYPSGSTGPTPPSIYGRVTGTGSAPVASATVSIVGTTDTTLTNGNGEYTFSNLAEGSYTLQFMAAGYMQGTVADVVVIEGESAEVDIELVAAGGGGTDIWVNGSVTDNLTLMPITGAMVQLLSGMLNLTANTDAGGLYTLHIPGATGAVNATLNVSAAGYSPASRALVLNPGSTVTENFQLVVGS
jgi:hypothetical protein